MLLLAALFGVGFLTAAALVRSILPWPTEYGLQAKWEHFVRHKDEYDAVFLGTSRVFRGVDTPAIEDRLRERGHPLRIFNFGVAGMRAFEEDHVLRRIVALEPQRLRYVFLEGGPWSPRFVFEELTYSSRSVFWHTPRETLTALDAVRRMDAAPGEKLRLAATHVDLFLWRLASYGQARILLDRLFSDEAGRARRAKALETIAVQEGFQAADQHTGRSFMKGREHVLEDPREYEAQVALIEPATDSPPPPETVTLAGVRGQRRLAAEHGLRLVYVIQPGYEGTPERVLLQRQGEIETLLDFNRPSRYPELFLLQNRYDEKHLNQRGARVFSTILADAIAEEILGARE